MATPVKQADAASTREPRQQAFLEKLAETGIVTVSARHAGIPRSTVYDWRRQQADFANAWADAEVAAAGALELEARRRAVDGVERPILYAGQFVRHEDGTIAVTRHYSDRLLEFLLRAHLPERYGAEALKRKSSGTQDENTQKGEGDALTDDERAARVAGLLERVGARGAGRPAGEE
jgi:transposase-like protein